MRSFRRLHCVLMFVTILAGLALVTGCDSDQPLQVGEQTVAITFEGGNARAPAITVFDMFLDNNGDNIPDDGQFYLWCIRVPNTLTTPTGAPIQFGVEAKVLRAGETVAEIITDVSSRATNANLTGYDVQATSFGAVAFPVTVNNGPGGTPQTYKHCQTTGPFAAFPPGCRIPRRTSPFLREVVLATSNPVSDFNPQMYGWGSGLCSRGDPGPEVVDGNAGGLELQIQKGDTLLVTMRRGPKPPQLIDQNGNSLFVGEPLLSATVSLDGAIVSPNGQTTTAAALNATSAFSLTTR